jgi:intracellular multiplication protein IcmT
MANNAVWRNTGLPVTFCGVDAKTLLPIIIWLLHMRMWTFYLACAGIVFFAFLSWRGITMTLALRLVRVHLIGNLRPRPESDKWHNRTRW